MFALVANASRIAPGCYVGKVVSTHRTAAAAEKARTRRNAACRRANGPGTWLDLAIGQVEHIDSEAGTARVLTDVPAIAALYA